MTSEEIRTGRAFGGDFGVDENSALGYYLPRIGHQTVFSLIKCYCLNWRDNMGWFQRYGFPGAYFWGLSALWLSAFYHCEFRNILTGDTAKTVGAIATASFLPIGYLISIIQQTIYLWFKKPWFGITGRAMKKANVFQDTNEREYLLEAEACLVVMSEKVEGRKGNNNKLDVDKQRFLQDWIRNRNNVMAINGSLMLATVLAFLTAFLVPYFCLKWEVQVEWGWFGLAIGVTVPVFLILFSSWRMLSKEVVTVEAGIYKMLAGLPGSNLVLRTRNSKETIQD